MQRAVTLLIPLLLLSASAVRADRVHLRDGRVIEGEVVRDGDGYEVRVPHGTVRVRADQVASIERAPTRHELLDQRLATLDRSDPEAIASLARWCSEQGLLSPARRLEEESEATRRRLLERWLAERLPAATTPEAQLALARWCGTNGFAAEAADLEARAREAALTRRLVDAREADGAEALVGLALALTDEGAPRHEVERVLLAAVALAPDHPEARRQLGQVKFRDRWETRARVDEIRATEHARRMRAEGKLLWRGSWVSSLEHQQLLQGEREEAHREAMREAEQARALAARQREEAEAHAASLRAEREQAERDRHLAEAEVARRQAALVETQRRNAEAEAARLEQEHALAASREAVAREALVTRLRRELSDCQARLRELRERKRVLQGAPLPARPADRQLRDAELRSLTDRISAAERERRELQNSLSRAESLCR